MPNSLALVLFSTVLAGAGACAAADEGPTAPSGGRPGAQTGAADAGAGGSMAPDPVPPVTGAPSNPAAGDAGATSPPPTPQGCEAPVPMFDGAPPCARRLATCLAPCTDQACADACYRAESNLEACFACLDQNSYACYDQACRTQMAAINCCGERNCPITETTTQEQVEACLQRSCPTELAAINTCAAGTAASACYSGAFEAGPRAGCFGS